MRSRQTTVPARCTLVLGLLVLFLSMNPMHANHTSSSDIPPLAGQWRCWLDSPGGELVFGLSMTNDGQWKAAITNGREREPVRSMHRAALDRAARKFSWEAQEDVFLELWQRVISR